MGGEADPRRSSRARTTQPQQSPSQAQPSSSSSSSTSSGRGERASRSSANKVSSPQLTTPTASIASEPPDESTTISNDALVRTLRSRATTHSDRDKLTTNPKQDQAGMASSDTAAQDDDESVRCICGFDEYPGPPLSNEDTRHGTKDTIDIAPFVSTDVPDEVAGFFLQCDICKVWQHGGCVGILTADASPEEYFCEQCRKDLHKIFVATNGQKYSAYLPVSRSSRSASRTTGFAPKEGTKSPKARDSRSAKPTQLTAQQSAASKRRSTMNSRHVYDEEEELRRAIEASKEEAHIDSDDQPLRRTKRGRSESEEKSEVTKRQRTGSRSHSPPDDSAIQDDSDDVPMRIGPSKKSRAATTRSQREKEEKEKQRAEAANKRKGRADRRRADDSDHSEEIPLAQRAAARHAAATEMPPPPRHSPPQPQTTSNSKNSRAKKATTSRKKGRNQYSKDRDERASKKRSASRDMPEHGGGGSRSRYARGNNAKDKDKGKDRDLSWLDMERRIAYWTDFTQKVELDLHLDRSAPATTEPSKTAIAAKKTSPPVAGSSSSSAAAGPSGSSTSSSSSFLALPSHNVPLNGGSPLKNVLQLNSDPPEVPTVVVVAPPASDVESSGKATATIVAAPAAAAAAPPPPPAAPGPDGAPAAAGEKTVENKPGETEKLEESEKPEREMNMQERLAFIKGRIKTWHSSYGHETRMGAT